MESSNLAKSARVVCTGQREWSALLCASNLKLAKSTRNLSRLSLVSSDLAYSTRVCIYDIIHLVNILVFSQANVRFRVIVHVYCSYTLAYLGTEFAFYAQDNWHGFKSLCIRNC
jgi:hypothetical protein